MKIEITDYRPPFKKLTGSLISAGFVFGPIYLGILAGSSAMQWAGFVFGFWALVGFITHCFEGNKRIVHSFDEARRAIDELEERAALSRARGEKPT